MIHYELNTPVGRICISGDNQYIYMIHFDNNTATAGSTGVILECAKQLQMYFSGELTSFNLPLHPQGSEFQSKVWERVLNIPFGKTVSYRQIALSIGGIRYMRAAGSAVGRNPLAIVIPCHRVVGSDGKLVGYAGGLWRKKWLIEHEKKARQLAIF